VCVCVCVCARARACVCVLFMSGGLRRREEVNGCLGVRGSGFRTCSPSSVHTAHFPHTHLQRLPNHVGVQQYGVAALQSFAMGTEDRQEVWSLSCCPYSFLLFPYSTCLVLPSASHARGCCALSINQGTLARSFLLPHSEDPPGHRSVGKHRGRLGGTLSCFAQQRDNAGGEAARKRRRHIHARAPAEPYVPPSRARPNLITTTCGCESIKHIGQSLDNCSWASAAVLFRRRLPRWR